MKPKISEMNVCDRPREKFYSRGLSCLTDIELLALALGKGTKEAGVMELAGKVLECINSGTFLSSPLDLLRINGIGKAKASSLIAAFEFANRRVKPQKNIIQSASGVYSLVRYLSFEKQEHFVCISLNGEHAPIATRVVTIGLVNRTQVHPREVFSDPIVDRAASIVVAHNHPSGSLVPSEADIAVTKVLKEAGELLGIPLLDHVIFSKNGYMSFKEENLIT